MFSLIALKKAGSLEEGWSLNCDWIKESKALSLNCTQKKVFLVLALKKTGSLEKGW